MRRNKSRSGSHRTFLSHARKLGEFMRRAKTIDELPHGFESGLARFFQKIHFTFPPPPLLRVTLDKPFSSKSISSVSPSAPCKYIIRVLLYGATSLQMNFLERFLPPSGRQTQKRRAVAAWRRRKRRRKRKRRERKRGKREGGVERG